MKTKSILLIAALAASFLTIRAEEAKPAPAPVAEAKAETVESLTAKCTSLQGEIVALKQQVVQLQEVARVWAMQRNNIAVELMDAQATIALFRAAAPPAAPAEHPAATK